MDDVARIFCFWEPRNRIPAYLKLCMETWRKFLPHYEIVLLDYGNLCEWIEEDDLDLETLKTLPMSAQADALRAMLLYRHGGLWLDLDTVVTSLNGIAFLERADSFTLINKHIAVISVSRPRHPIVAEWLRNIRLRLKFARWYRASTSRLVRFARIAISHFFHTRPPLTNTWDFMGNAPLEFALRKYGSLFYSIDRIEAGAMPETSLSASRATDMKVYVEYYFTRRHVDDLMKAAARCHGIICLHNSWTPKTVRQMNEKEFLSSGLALAELLRDLLGR